MRARDDETATELIFGEELVNTSDATVKRITFEKSSHDRACNRAKAQFDVLIASYDAVFVNRVGRILQDADVELPPLPAQFQESRELA